MRTATALLCTTILCGCTGTVHTTDLNVMSAGELRDVPGVIFYPPMLVKQTIQTTQLLDKNGKVVADKDGEGGHFCKPVRTEKIVSMPDYNHPKRVYYAPGLFESNTFGVTMDAAGMLTGVNSQSNPDQGKTAQALATTIGILATAAATTGLLSTPWPGTAPAALPACTDGTEVVSYVRWNVP